MANEQGPPKTQLEHICRLDLETPAQFVRLTGIICTVGPACQSVAMLEKMMEAGMTIARLNCSHGTLEYHAQSIENVRQASKNYSKRLGTMYPVAIALDTKGAEIRTGTIDNPAGEVELKRGDTLKLTTNIEYAERGKKEIIYVDYVTIVDSVTPGAKIFIDDGAISLIVYDVTGDILSCTVDYGGTLGSRKGVNLPGIQIDLPAVSDKDILDLKFGLQQEVDMIFASFISSAADLKLIRGVLGEDGKNIKIISKIENHLGIQNFAEIAAASDGIMVARGDLGIEIPFEKVFIAQKAMVARCNKLGKPVICATEMLESMVKKHVPKRSEISDTANAVLDGADCLMLTIETAKGDFPLESVITLARTCKEAEAAMWHRNLFDDLIAGSKTDTLDAAHSVAVASVEAAGKSQAAAIIVITTTGKSAHLISKYRPKCPIIAVTRFPQTARQALIYRGIIPLVYADTPIADWLKDVDTRVQYALQIAKQRGYVKSGDPVVIVTGWKHGAGFTNTMRVVYAYYDMDVQECILRMPPRKRGEPF